MRSDGARASGLRSAFCILLMLVLSACSGGSGTSSNTGDTGIADTGEDVTEPDAGEDITEPDAGEDVTEPDAGEDATEPDAGEDTGEDVTEPDAGEDTGGEDVGPDAPPPVPRSIVVSTGGGGLVRSATQRAMIGIGAPQPMGTASSDETTVNVGPSAARP